MANEENKTSADLFSGGAVKPLFSADEDSMPIGKPLFDSELSEQGDAAFVKPLFGNPEEESPSVPAPEEDPTDFSVYDQEDTFPAEPEPAEEPAGFAAEPLQEAPSEPAPTPAPEIIPEPAAEPLITAPEPESIPEPAPKRIGPATTITLHGDLEAMSLGTLMRLARETAQVTEEEVYECTKINSRYLNAIEQDRFEDLPRGAFPGAYVRALSSLYRLDPAAKEISQKKAAEYCTAVKAPNEVYDRLQDNALINKEEREKFRRWFIIAVTFFALLIALSILLVITFSMKKSTEPEQLERSPVTMESLEQLSGPQMPVMRKLNVPGK